MDTILEAAAQVLTDQGYSRTTTNHIALKAGVSIGSLYQYFPNKEAIVISLMEDHMKDSAAVIDGLLYEARGLGRLTPEIIKRLITAMLDQHSNGSGFHQAVFEEMPPAKELWEVYLRAEDQRVDQFQALFGQTPQIRKDNKKSAARMMFRMVETMVHRHVIRGFGRMDDAVFVEETTDMVCRYLFRD